MTERTAWQKCAAWCARNPHRPHLCWLLAGTGENRTIPLAFRDFPREEMLARLKHHAEWSQFMWVCLGSCESHAEEQYTVRDGRHARVIFCLLMALECEEEANA